MGKYGNIDGIVTLTNNPVAIDNAKGTIGKLQKERILKELKSHHINEKSYNKKGIS